MKIVSLAIFWALAFFAWPHFLLKRTRGLMFFLSYGAPFIAFGLGWLAK